MIRPPEMRAPLKMVFDGAASTRCDVTLLHDMAYTGDIPKVRILLERGADPNLAHAPWATPLTWARAKGHTDIAGDLVRAGARS